MARKALRSWKSSRYQALRLGFIEGFRSIVPALFVGREGPFAAVIVAFYFNYYFGEVAISDTQKIIIIKIIIIKIAIIAIIIITK